MATLTLPTTPNFFSARFELIANTQVFSSPLDKTVQTLELTGARWQGNYSLPIMVRATAAPWTAILTELLGMSGRFFGFDPVAKLPRGSGTGDSPLVKGASQTGKSLITDAWTIDQTGLLLPGDFFEVNSELKMVTASVDSDGSGDATISFVPSLRASPANNAVITQNNPTCIMRLLKDNSASWDLSGKQFYGISFVGIEAFA